MAYFSKSDFYKRAFFLKIAFKYIDFCVVTNKRLVAYVNSALKVFLQTFAPHTADHGSNLMEEFY